VPKSWWQTREESLQELQVWNTFQVVFGVQDQKRSEIEFSHLDLISRIQASPNKDYTGPFNSDSKLYSRVEAQNFLTGYLQTTTYSFSYNTGIQIHKSKFNLVF
jgi:hypothetical protein